MNQEKLRIMHVTNTHAPSDGGVVQAVKTIVSQQQQNKIDCLVATLSTVKPDPENEYPVQTIPTFFTYANEKNKINIPWLAHYYVKKISSSWKPSIMHVHHPFLLGHAAVRLARWQRIPTIFTFHSLYEEHINTLPYILKPMMSMLIRSFCNKVDKILVPNNKMKKYVEEYDIIPPVVVLPNPIGNDIVPLDPPKIKSHLKLPLKLLVVSRLTPEKNIEAIIDCIKVLAVPGELIIAGYGHWQASLEVYIKKSFGNAKAPITFCSNPTRAKLNELYAWADLLLFSSSTSAQGLVLAEAMAHATPVVALKGPGQNETIINNYNGFLVDSAVQMAVVIYQLVLNPNLYMLLQKGSLETSQKYRAATIVQTLNDHYSETIATYKRKSWSSLFLKHIS